MLINEQQTSFLLFSFIILVKVFLIFLSEKEFPNSVFSFFLPPS